MTGDNNAAVGVVLLLMSAGVHAFQGTGFWSVALRPELLPPGGQLAPANCDMYYGEGLLTEHQYLICLEDRHILAAVVRGLRRAVYLCQENFKDLPWNCTAFAGKFLLGRAIASIDSREAVYANTLISAALTYDIAVACREKQLPDCPCSSDLPFLTRLPDGAVLLGGCGDNVAYGADTTWSFVHGEGSEGEPSARQNMSTHNHNLALNLLNDTVVDCRCHGFSTACNIKTCARRLHDFKATGQKLLQRYGGAVQVEGGGQGQLVPTGRHSSPPTPEEMVFIQDSPDYCTPNSSLDIIGTHDRLCSPAQTSGAGSCTHLCCGRGYYTKEKLVSERNCRLLYDKAKRKYRVDCVVVRQHLVPEYRCH